MVELDMPFILPYPDSPQNGDAGDADPIRSNFQAIAQGIQSFDGSQLQAGTVQESALAASINPRLRGSETIFDFVQSGCIWSSGGGLNGSMSGGIAYIQGYRVVIPAIGSKSFTASRDTYVDIDYLGNVTYQEVTNNAASPSLTANSVRVAIIVTDGSAIVNGGINQGQHTALLPIATSVPYAVTDSLGNLICPRDPNRLLLGYRQILSTFTTASTAAPVQITGLTTSVVIPPNNARKVKVSVEISDLTNTNVASMYVTIWEGAVGSGTLLKNIRVLMALATGGTFVSAKGMSLPSAGQKTYSIGLHVNTGTAAIESGGIGSGWVQPNNPQIASMSVEFA